MAKNHSQIQKTDEKKDQQGTDNDDISLAVCIRDIVLALYAGFIIVLGRGIMLQGQALVGFLTIAGGIALFVLAAQITRCDVGPLSSIITFDDDPWD